MMSSLTSCGPDRWVPPVCVCQGKKKEARLLVLRGLELGLLARARARGGSGLGPAGEGKEARAAAFSIFLTETFSSFFKTTKQDNF